MALGELDQIITLAKICEELDLSLTDVLHLLFHETETVAIINQIGIEKIIKFQEKWIEEIIKGPELAPAEKYAKLRLEYLKKYSQEFREPPKATPPAAAQKSLRTLPPTVSPEEAYEYMVDQGLASKDEMSTYAKVSKLFNECIVKLDKERKSKIIPP